MAEILDIEINIGANTEDLSAELQKAENLLSKLQAKLKKSTDVGEIQKLNAKISSVEGSISTLSSRINGVAKPTNDATNALSNLSRVAQDAPYGFIGIANNLNPLLESFQRLQTRSGSATEALKSMAAGLVGPAGIGLALGVVSSLAVTFSDEIAAFFIGPTEKLKKFREELNKLNTDIYKIVGEAQSNRTIGLNLVNIISGGNPTQQQEALKRLKALYSDNKAIKDATIKTDKAYLVHLINVAAIQEDAAGKEKTTQQILASAYAERRKLEAQRDADLKKVTASGGSAEYNKNKADKERERIAKGYNLLITDLDSIIAKAKTKNAELLNTLTNIETPSPEGKAPPKAKKDKTLPLKEAQDLIRQINKTNKLLTPLEEVISGDTAIEDLKKQHEDYLKYLTGVTKDKEKITKKNLEQEGKDLEDLTKKYENFSMTIASSVTGALVGMFEAMQEGISFGDALGQMFGRLAQQIAETLVQAAIFAGIFSLLSGGAGATGGLSFFGAFTKILGLASGGVATGPTLAMIGEGSESEAVLPLSKLGNMMQTSFNAGSMNTNNMAQNGQFVLKGNDLVLALQRSNSSLNLRRGI
jgi:archaellum component FlaC